MQDEAMSLYIKWCDTFRYTATKCMYIGAEFVYNVCRAWCVYMYLCVSPCCILGLCSESESFESFVVQRLDDMLKRAYSLEKDLQEQKQKLRGRLTLLSHTLLGMMDEETEQ